jgi:hypothetical protein
MYGEGMVDNESNVVKKLSSEPAGAGGLAFRYAWLDAIDRIMTAFEKGLKGSFSTTAPIN